MATNCGPTDTASRPSPLTPALALALALALSLPIPDPDPSPSPAQEKLKAEQEAAMQKAMEDAKRAAEEQARSLVTTPSSSRPRSG